MTKSVGAPAIPGNSDGEIVRDYFRAMNLDPDKPEHWFALVKAFIEDSKKRARAGAPTRWTDQKLLQLRADFVRIQRERPNKSESDICRALARRGVYGDLDWKTLRRRLHDSRNPERNRFLGRVLETLMDEYSNPPEELRKWLTTGSTDVFQDEHGNIEARSRLGQGRARDARQSAPRRRRHCALRRSLSWAVQ
jgi:hypothetical protein